MIIRDEADFFIRDAKATDVAAIYELIKPNSEKAMMLPRSRYKIFSRLQGFVVLEDKATHRLMGCAALVILWGDMAEVQSLAVLEECRGKGYGRKIVACLLEKARHLEIPKVLSLTYQVEFFSKLGFVVVDKNTAPRKIWGECLECPKLENCDETAMVYYMNPTDRPEM